MTGTSNGPGREESDQDNEAIRQRLKELEGKIGQFRSRQNQPPPPDATARGSALGYAARMATELVVGVAVGGVIGWALDNWFGTSPLLLVVFLILGSAAGILNVMRSAQEMQAKNVPPPAADLPPSASDDEDK